MRRRVATSAACILFGSLTIALALRPPEPDEGAADARIAEPGLARLVAQARSRVAAEPDTSTADTSPLDRALALPTGEPTALACDDARTVVLQARSSLASPASPIDAVKFAEGTIDWLDPHGLWSVAGDAPAGAEVRRRRERLLAELEAEPGSSACVNANAIGAELHRWAAEIGVAFDRGVRDGVDRVAREDAPGGVIAEGWRIASATPFEDGKVTRTARELAQAIGRSAGAVRGAYGDSMTPYVEAMRARLAPDFDVEAWGRVVTAAALRAYVPQLDAHGAWAPLDEELSIYDLALEASPPEQLWSDMTRTAVGVRIDHGALAPLANGDVVLRVQDVPLAGVSVEQVEQLSVIEGARHGSPVKVTVLRATSPGPIELSVSLTKPVAAASPPGTAALAVDLVRYADGRAAIVPIADVPDDLGARLSDALDRARAAGELRGVVLDLRSNGGGSTDGAAAALGLFLPGASLFPMRRRDGQVEVERAPEASPEKRWNGPLAVIVDGDSASAAEMIAGALGSYRRAVIVGDKTYGKGCAQEYLDDEAHSGVLRLTTLLFSLPDGSPLQKVGILPNVRFALPATHEREANLVRALEPWRGPDVRDVGSIREVPWPSHSGKVGPCSDAAICRALRALGATPSVASRRGVGRR